MALIQISNLNSAASFLTELQEPDTKQIVGGSSKGDCYGGKKEGKEKEEGKKKEGYDYDYGCGYHYGCDDD